MILNTIVKNKRKVLGSLKRRVPLDLLMERTHGTPRARAFKGALSGRTCAIIAEVKRSSPSKGRLKEDFDPVAMARQYEAHGAAAISVLTEETYFEGSLSYLYEIKENTSIPILRKDFIIDPYQIYETKVFGGDALLLITRILSDEELHHFLHLTETLGLAALVEVHTPEELDRALAAGADIVGVNNRDLHTFATDIATSIDMARHIPGGILTVSESGIGSHEDIQTLTAAGINAFLVGEALMKATDIATVLTELVGKGA